LEVTKVQFSVHVHI